MLAVLFQLESSQWLASEELLALQRLQLAKVLAHALSTVPHYQESFQDIRMKRPADFTWEAWRQLPLLTRRAVQTAGTRLLSTAVPAGHGSLCRMQTSGSTGTPVTTYGTDVSQLFWKVFGLRDHLWHGRDFTAKHAFIRSMRGLKPGDSGQAANWGLSTAPVFATGPAVRMSILTDVAAQAEWLMQQAPGYLLSYPSNILALARLFRERNWQLPGLKEVRTIGETVGGDVREICQEVWGAPVKDMYSSQEIGYIALQCPGHEHYHVQSEAVLVEVLDDADVPCPPGGIGRVVVTALHNFTMPLLRYELGDYAEVGEPCPCGRGLPVLTRILGRQRNILTAPDGRKYWPSFPASKWADSAPVRQVQIIQTDMEKLTVNLVADRALLEEEERRLIEGLRALLPYPFQVSLSFVERIERSRSGKYEDFVSLVG